MTGVTRFERAVACSILVCVAIASQVEANLDFGRNNSNNKNHLPTVDKNITFRHEVSPWPSKTDANQIAERYEPIGMDSFRKFTPMDYVNISATTAQQMEASHTYFYRGHELNNTVSVSKFVYQGLIAKYLSAVYTDSSMHLHDSYELLKAGDSPTVDQEKCLNQLTYLVNRSDQIVREKFETTDLNMFMFLDSFGRMPAGTLIGASVWAGHYDQCVKLKLMGTNNEQWSTRYCLASLRHVNWPKSSQLEKNIVFKSALCLPKVCDSLNYKNKYDMINKLISFNSRQFDKGDLALTAIYCLPDEDSPLRKISYSRASLITAWAFGVWILVLVYSTVKYELYKREKLRIKRDSCISKGIPVPPEFRTMSPLEETKSASLSTGFDVADERVGAVSPTQLNAVRYHNSRYIKIFKSMSIINNLKLLFTTDKASALLKEPLDDNNSKQTIDSRIEQEVAEQIEQKPIVDLRPLEGIKVICMCYVITGHVLMCLTTIMKNGQDLASTSSPSFFVANLIPAFAVNSFFTITGLLTSYLLFKQNKSLSPFKSPVKWMAFILYRYLRIMPMYVIVVLYAKFLARYTGSGPLWDYGTSSISQRRACERESWVWTLLFGANFKPPLEHCIPSAWYLANDFHFFIITPVFLYLLHQNSTLGKRVLAYGMLVGYLAGFWSIWTSNVDDLRPVAQFMPHGFKTYVSYLSFNYTQPQYRIPSYLCGLLVGYVLHEFEQRKISWLKRQLVRRYEEAERKCSHKKCNLTNLQSYEGALQSDEINKNQQDQYDDDLPIEEEIELRLADPALEEQDEKSRQMATPDITIEEYPPKKDQENDNEPETDSAIGSDNSNHSSDEHDKQVNHHEADSELESIEEEPNWHPILNNYGFRISLFCVFACCVTPIVGARIPFNKVFAKLAVAFIMPSYHVLFSAAVGIYLLLASTGYGNKTISDFLGAPIWKPFARLSLCAVLINVEVINYLVQTNTDTLKISSNYQFSMDLYAIMWTYIMATICCVLFEAPMRAALNHLLRYCLSRLASKKSKKD